MPTQESVTTEHPTDANSLPLAETFGRGLGGTALQMGGAVVLVVALILVLQRLAKRAHPGWGGKSREGGIEIVSQRPLGKGLSLLVVRTHGQTLLLGTSPQGVTPVASLTAESESGEIEALASPARSAIATTAAAPARSYAEPFAKAAPLPPARGASAPAPVSAGPAPVSSAPASVSAAPAPVPARVAASAPARARGVLRSIAARAVSRRPDDVRRSALADLEEAARIADEARARDEQLAQNPGESVDLREFETEFRAKLRAIREKYETLDEAEGHRA